MRLKNLALLAGLVLAITSPLRAQRELSLPPEQIAGAISAVLSMRPGMMEDSMAVDFCTLTDALDGDTAWVGHLPAFHAGPVRRQLAGGCGGGRAELDAPVVLRVVDFDVETGGRIRIRAIRSAPSFTFHEAYEVRREPSGAGPSRWRLDSIELSDFVHSLPPPPIPRPPSGSPPAAEPTV